MAVHQRSLSGVAVYDRRAGALWLGASGRDPAGWGLGNSGHTDRLRLRDHPKQADRHWQDQGARRRHMETGDARAIGARRVRHFSLAGKKITARIYCDFTLSSSTGTCSTISMLN